MTALLLVAAIAPAPARGDWYDYYQDALQAIDRGKHGRAVQLLETALERKKGTGYFRTYGNNYIRYVPRFYLGVAYHGAGDWERALASFDLSEEAGETAAVPSLDTRMRSLRAACESQLAPPPAQPVETSGNAPAASTEPDTAKREEPRKASPLIHADPRLLERGLGVYLRGDFDTAAGVFGELVESAPRSPRLRLLLGMALHGSWVMGGEKADALIGRSRRELAEAARLDPALVPDPALCPPRVVALFRSLRKP